MFKMLKKQNIGIINLSNQIRITDPSYSPTTWCAGTLNILPGNYQCFSQKVDTGEWGIRIASIEIRHENFLNIEPIEKTDIDVGVDSGQCGIFDLAYFLKMNLNTHINKEIYDIICKITYQEWTEENKNYIPFENSIYYKKDNGYFDYIDNTKISKMYYHLASFEAGTLENKCVVSSSGDGDGSYLCYIGKNKNNEIVSVKIDYYPSEEDYY